MATPDLPSMGSPCPCSHVCPTSGSRSFLPDHLLVPSPGERHIQREDIHPPPSMNTRRQTSGQKRIRGGEVAHFELCFSPARRMEEEEVTDADVTINFSSLDVAVDELVCFSPARRIKRGVNASPRAEWQPTAHRRRWRPWLAAPTMTIFILPNKHGGLLGNTSTPARFSWRRQ